MRRQPDAGRAGAMLLRTNKLAAFMLFVAIMMLPVLLYINKRYKVPGAGIRITGLE
jgi:hypothetical protein